jgi:DNA-binding MarR family transcriptional regulator
MSRYSAEDVFHLVLGEIAALLTYTAASARHYNLSISEIAALEFLEQAGELTLGQIGKHLLISSGAVTALVDRLERTGYVQRTPHPHDRRSSLVRSTGTGTEKVRQRQAALAEEIRTITEKLSSEEREIVGQYLKDLTATLARHTQNLVQKEAD